MKIIAIVAATENNVIGIGNDLPWRLPDDFKYFKQKTLGHTILMGKNTWLSLGRPLPQRENIIVSASLNERPKGTLVFTSLDEAMEYCKDQSVEQLFVIGGGVIFKEMFSVLDEILMTRIHAIIDGGEVFFPAIDPGEWEKVWEEFHPADERHQYAFTFERWLRKDRS